MKLLAWSLLAFLSGSIPFSPWIGRLVAGVDIRDYGDRNPGATNVSRAIGRGWGFVAALLDGLKGALPVGLAWFGLGISGWGLLPVALAPVLGHAASPWLGWKGGKAVAVTFGVWAGLTLGAGPSVLGALLALNAWLWRSSAWATLFSMLEFGGFILPYYAPMHPEFAWIWAGNLFLLAWKQRGELTAPPRLRRRLFRRGR